MRITSSYVERCIKQWNEYHKDIPMGCTFTISYAAIGHLGERGDLSIVASGETPREAWEKFQCWVDGYKYALGI